MTKLFGTDGIRARAGLFPLDAPTVTVLGRALARLLAGAGLARRVLIGRDTRESGGWLERALARGIAAAGGTSDSAGIIPTSAVSYLTHRHGYGAGVVLSASHNPYEDNGIKIFGPAGLKIADDWEDALERAIRDGGSEPVRCDGACRAAASLAGDYAAFLRDRFMAGAGARNGRRFKVVIDCANGAAARLAPSIFRELGFETEAIHDGPDGRNINLGCGSLHPEDLARAVTASGADLGIAYDGDADRALWVDEAGRILTGDHTLYVQARHLREAGRLRSDIVVATIMSNMGLEQALRREGLRLVRTQVGDRHVLDEMRRSGAGLGGERSGHTIFLDDLATGDGLLTSLKMVEAMIAADRPLSALTAGYEEFPQILVNVRVREKLDFTALPAVVRAAAEVRSALGEDGRLELRYSGTEPVARIMIEGPDGGRIEALAAGLAETIRRQLGGVEDHAPEDS